MKPATIRRLSRPAGCGLLLCAVSACASQAKYEEAVAEAKYYQSKSFDAEELVHRLEVEMERLQKDLAMRGVTGLEDASFQREVENRLLGLQDQLAELGRPPGDIERFDVEGGYVYMVQDKILFPSGSAELSDEGRRAIAGLIREIQARPHGKIWVRGHTDSDRVVKPATLQRFPHGNLQLSAARAIEVAAILTEGGVPAADVAVVGFGPHLPLQANDNAESKRLNRRVEIFVSNPGE